MDASTFGSPTPAPGDLTAGDLDAQLDREWLAVNGLGGFACSTVPGLNTRKYHGLLVAAMSPPVQRMVLLSRVEETVVCDGWSNPLACNEYPGAIFPRGDQLLRGFSPDPFPRWAYQADGWTIEKTLRLITGRNAVVLTYTLLAGSGPREVELQLRPMFALRGIHELSYQWNGQLAVETRGPGNHRVPPTGRTPEAFFAHDGVFEESPTWYLNTIYRREQQRGYAGLEDLWNPGVVHWSLRPGESVQFVCSTDPIELAEAVATAEEQGPAVRSADGDPTLAALTRAAEQFLLTLPPLGNRATRYVAASYPWAPPSPRHALMGFAGLFLVTGQFDAAREFLLDCADRLQGGLLPSSLTESGDRPLYHGVDPSLWFVNAVYDYLRYTGDDDTVGSTLIEAVTQVMHWYREGTALGIRADVDGLLMTNQPGVPTTWMDAVADGWVVTPRGGKAVEVNALWHNAVCIAAQLSTRFKRAGQAESLSRLAATIRTSFNYRFWNVAAGCCYDVLDATGNDSSVRPNQLLAITLPFPVLAAHHFEAMLETVRATLLTPMGLRTLAPSDPAYRGHYAGNVVERDRAFHQGSVHPWLLGPYVSAYLKLHGRGAGARSEARQLLEPCLTYLRSTGCGQLCELFDGDPPHRPGGAIAASASVAEVLRVYVQGVLDRDPPMPELARRSGPAERV